MAQVINLNRFRKKKAKAEKERRAEQNRRLHGRTKAERRAEEFEKAKLEKKLEGALLVPERVDVVRLGHREPAQALADLERATRGVVSMSEFSARLKQEKADQPGGSDSEER